MPPEQIPAEAPDFIAVYRIAEPIVGPILGGVGMILTVWPRSDTHTLAVCSTGAGRRVVRHCGVPAGQLYGMVMEWEDMGIIEPLSSVSSLSEWQRTA